MKQFVHNAFKKAALALAAFLLLYTASAQTSLALVFRNPVLEQGIAGDDGAVYRFGNITDGVDGLLKIKKRSDAAVVLEDIDVAGIGWEQALQPRLGVSGSVRGNSVWWMQFELLFVQRHTTRKVTLNHFVATPIDVDGDNVAVREFVQMDKTKAVAYSPLTCLKTETALSKNVVGEADNMTVGPLTSFGGIDTAATAVMAAYTYENKDAITFTIGAVCNGAVSNSGMAGMRLNSLWFKNFSLAPQATLPVSLETFSAAYARKVIRLNWKTSGRQDLSHFVVERSVNGRTYSDIAVIPAKRNNGANRYGYKDKPVIMDAGMVYYRLRMVDKHRPASYSSVSAVQAKDGRNANRVAGVSKANKNGIGLLGKAKH